MCCCMFVAGRRVLCVTLMAGREWWKPAHRFLQTRWFFPYDHSYVSIIKLSCKKNYMLGSLRPSGNSSNMGLILETPDKFYRTIGSFYKIMLVGFSIGSSSSLGWQVKCLMNKFIFIIRPPLWTLSLLKL